MLVENRQQDPMTTRHDAPDRTSGLTEQNACDRSPMSCRAITTLTRFLELLERSTSETGVRTVNWTIEHRYPDARIAL